MAVIKVPRPPAEAFDLNRPVSTLLNNQIRHLQEAEFRLPASMQTNTYINAIKTEGQAAEYIRRVTEALHRAHAIGPEIGARPVTKTAARARKTTGRDLAAAAATPRKSKGNRGGSKKKARAKKAKNRN